MNLEQLDREALKEQAELLGVKFDSKTADKTLRNKIQAKLGEPVEEVELSHASVKKDESRITIILNESDIDKQPVVVGLNGRNFVMKRGKPVAVPAEVIEILNNAKKVVWNMDMNEHHSVMRYPYQVVAQ